MDEDAIRTLKQAHRFEEWYGRNTLPESLFISGFFLRKGLLEGWRLERVTPIRIPGVPQYAQSIWVPQSGPTQQALLRLDVYECESRRAAHELLLRNVGQFQSAGVTRREDLGLGDVNFVPMANGGVLFTRGNLLFFLAEGGPARLPVAEIARQLDRELSAKPAPGVAARALGPPPAESLLEPTERAGRWILRLGRPATATAAARGIERRVYSKIFSSGGEVHAEGEDLVVDAVAQDPPTVEVYTVDEEGNTDRRQVRAPGS